MGVIERSDGRLVYDPLVRSSQLYGIVEIERVVEAVNSLGDDNARCSMIAALKLHAPHVRWITLRDGRLSVA